MEKNTSCGRRPVLFRKKAAAEFTRKKAADRGSGLGMPLLANAGFPGEAVSGTGREQRVDERPGNRGEARSHFRKGSGEAVHSPADAASLLKQRERVG
ncbi:hypothetical protein B4135_1472 [Caldibacillus debilis]|uniref:Uncharacterized protein n=1 Tax=Caldibacillus debilis TaxID=301148 RepID=A0A150MC18_9BACI|nr:hypothetical protein B4135_1472 [Caldibacillus debilis]